ncbi:MAG TPA: class I SAM-dependent methyltransferase [Gemmatimonadaceae bacterium]|nr:class I SAM-dependent methyltransferase [Gemmatimonadaceae bacterium]
MTDFKDHFSGHAREYAEFRPTYPPALFDFVTGLSAGHALAWDSATGNGQAAIGLAERYDRVLATDASAAQIANAMPHPRIEYRVAPGEVSGLPDGAADLVTVAQSMHWLDPTAFFTEAARVMAPGGAVAVWGYGLCSIGADLDDALHELYRGVLGEYWPAERRMVDEGYRNLEFPFRELPAPELSIERTMSLGDFEGYLYTWSATRRYLKKNDADPIAPFIARIASTWGARDSERLVRWPLHFRVGRR